MADYLLYWKTFWTESTFESASENHDWHTTKASFWDEVVIGDTFWIVIVGGPGFEDEWRLLQKMTVSAKWRNDNLNRPYVFSSQSDRLSTFSLDQSDFSQVLRSFKFTSGKSISATGRRIGNALQSPRRLNSEDTQTLQEYSKNILKISKSKTNRTPFSRPEIILCAYAAIYDSSDFGGIGVIQRLQSRSLSSIKLKIQNIVAMLDEEGLNRNNRESALTGLPKGERGRRTNWDIVESYITLSRHHFLQECLAIIENHERPDSENLALGKIHVEGAVRQIVVNAYERDIKARERCIDHYKARCWVCRFDFEEFYGPEAKGFIHVHHLKPLSEIAKEYKVDPIADLRPLCPNCHAFVHLGPVTRDVDELRSMLNPRIRE